MEKNKNIENFLKHVSKKDSGWLEKAKWRQENEDWLDISFSIAVRIGSTLSANKKANVHPKTQVELAELMGCSPQYVNKLLKGEERLQIDTICKIGSILGIKLIEVPKIESKQTLHYNPVNSLIGEINLISPAIHSSKSYAEVEIEVKAAGENNYALAA
jgi:transcriptional regulator with XRE-family HTH domain